MSRTPTAPAVPSTAPATVFLDPGPPDFYVDWERAAGDVVAVLRSLLMIWTAEPGTKSAEALTLLGSWAATPDQPEREEPPGHP